MTFARLLLTCLLVSAAGACGEDADSPSSPSPMPPPAPTLRALLMPFGNFRWTDCIGSAQPSCTFAASLRNVGNGCAIRVEGTVRLFSAQGFQVGTTYRFVLPPQQIVAPGEQIPYFVPFIPVFAATAATDYVVSPVWIDTPCF
jgi:hypothetical protein